MPTPLPLPPEYAPRTIASLFLERVSAAPDRLGFVAKFQGGAYRSVTYAEWGLLTTRLAAALHDKLGVNKGTKVAWVLNNQNGGEALLLYHAVHLLGAINVPINPRLAPPEVKYILEHSEAAVALFPSSLGRQLMPVLEGIVPSPTAVAIGEPILGAYRFEDLLEETDARLPTTPIDTGDEANLLYTSGTTGRPKGVLHTHGSSLASAIGWSDAFRFQGTDVLGSPFPIFTGGGLHFNGLAILWGGGTYVLDDYETESSLKLMEQYRTTVYVAVPSIYQFMLESPLLPTVNLSNLRILDYGGASMAPATIKRLYEAIPGVRLMQTFGLTEGGPGGLYLCEEYALSKLGSVGNRCGGRFTQFRVVDDEGNDVGPDVVGEFLLGGPSVMKGYFKDPDATAQALKDGWLHTGDLVYIDRDGFVYHVDRKKDIVVRGGFNISSVEVESALMEHSAVQEAAVVAKPHPKLGEDLKAFVVLRPGCHVTAAELTAFCQERLADFKVPRDITLKESLPRNAVGKILKRELRTEVSDVRG